MNVKIFLLRIFFNVAFGSYFLSVHFYINCSSLQDAASDDLI